MDPAIWHKIAGVSGTGLLFLRILASFFLQFVRRRFLRLEISGAAAVALGAYGAHVFKPENPVYKEVLIWVLDRQK